MFKLFSRSKDITGNTISVGEQVTITSYGAVKLPWALFVPASFKVNIEGTVIYIDPFLVEDSELADYILLTHDHLDHCSAKDIKRLVSDTTKIICSKSSAKKLKRFSGVQVVEPGFKDSLGALDMETLPSYNQKRGWLTAHPQKSGFLGFHLSHRDFSLFHAGDSDFIEEHKRLTGLTVAMLPIGGDNLTMDTEAALQFTETVKPEIVIPMHYECGKEGSFINVAKKFSRVVTLTEEI